MGSREAETNWLSSLVLGVKQRSGHVLRGFSLKEGEARLQTSSRQYLTPESKGFGFPSPAPAGSECQPTAELSGLL